MGFVFLGVGVGIYRLVQDHLFQSVDATLMASANAIREGRLMRGSYPNVFESFAERFLGDKFIRPHAQLVDLSGEIRASSGGLDGVRLPVTPLAVNRAEQGMATIETFKRSGYAPLRLVTLPVIRNMRFTGELVQVGAPLDAIHETLRGINIQLWTILPCGLLLSIVAGYFVTRRALKPVVEMQRAAAKISIEDLTRRIKVPGATDELRDLAITFNRMLDGLQESVKRLRRFTGDVSHEMRTPLSVIRAESQLALRRDRSGEEYRQAISKIENESKKLASIIEDLLLLARAESQAIEVTWSNFDLEPFFDEIQESLKQEFASRGVKLAIENQVSHKVSASPSYLAMILDNLLINAAKHSKPGQEVTISAWELDGRLQFQVTDRGEGIAECDLPHIFETFYRADTARNRSAGGVGIGLSLAVALVKLHGGLIKVDSKEGFGTSFLVAIPQAERLKLNSLGRNKKVATENKPSPHLKAVLPSSTS